MLVTRVRLPACAVSPHISAALPKKVFRELVLFALRVGGAISFGNSIAWAHSSEARLEKGRSFEESFLGGARAKQGDFWARRVDGTNSIEIT